MLQPLKKRVSHSYRACVRPRVFILLLFAWMHLTTRKSELYFPFLTLRTCYSSCVVFEQSRKKTPSIRQSCQNKLLKHFVSIQITVTSTHVEGFDPVSCGLLFWKEIEKKFLYHPSFRRFSRKLFLVKIVSFWKSLTRSENHKIKERFHLIVENKVRTYVLYLTKECTCKEIAYSFSLENVERA